jgi:hypothetical protein
MTGAPLNPYDREVVTDGLRPDPGYVLDRAVGTTFSVDLEAMMMAPLAFAMFDTEDTGNPDPVVMLAAIRSYSEKIALYCDLVGIRASRTEPRLFALLEDSLLPVHAPQGGVFHPKVWVLRFERSDDPGNYRHRILVLTRNLTFDRSWDLLVRLDESGDQTGDPIGREVADFLIGLDGLKRSEHTRLIASTIENRRFPAPAPFTSVSFHSLGLKKSQSGLFPEPGQKRLLVISPFLEEGQLRRIAEIAPSSGERDLVSLPMEMDRIGGGALQSFGKLWQIHDEAGSVEDEDGPGDRTAGAFARGLHAKCYVIDRKNGKNTTWFVGSSNATTSGFHRNVEVLVELRGSTGNVGVERILEEAEKGAVSFRSLLLGFRPASEDPEIDPMSEDRNRIERIAREIARSGVHLDARPESDGWRVDLMLGASRTDLGLGRGDRLFARLATSGGKKPLSDSAERVRFRSPPTARLFAPEAWAITALVEFRLESGKEPTGPKEQRSERTFIVLADLNGAPSDRAKQLLVHLVESEERFRQLIFLLLASSDPESKSASDGRRFISMARSGDGSPYYDLGIPLFEALVRSYARDPERLDTVARVVDAIRASEEGRSRLPQGFEEMWSAFRPAGN